MDVILSGDSSHRLKARGGGKITPILFLFLNRKDSYLSCLEKEISLVFRVSLKGGYRNGHSTTHKRQRYHHWDKRISKTKEHEELSYVLFWHLFRTKDKRLAAVKSMDG